MNWEHYSGLSFELLDAVVVVVVAAAVVVGLGWCLWRCKMR